MKRPGMNRRATLFFVFFSVLFFALLYRFFVIQLSGEVDGKALARYAEEKYSKSRVLKASRGTIFDRNGEVVAKDTVAYRLVAILDPSVTPEGAKMPNHVADPGRTAKALAQVIHMPEEEIYKRLTLAEKGYFQVEFGEAGRGLSYETKEKIEQMNLPGITFIRESKRSYPNGIFASHLIGFASQLPDSTDGKLVGQMGIEKMMDKYLRGEDGKIEYESDVWGFILPNAEAKIIKAHNGANVFLTIDKKIQTFLEEAMNTVQNEYNPKRMMAIVADAKTGAILAMAQRPTFNPNTKEGLADNWQNIIVESAFEPGSTMKVFTLASAIEEGVFHPNETYQSGSFRVEGAPEIRDHNGTGWGVITYLRGVQLSSNVAMARLVQKMGTDVFRNYLDRFHFGQPTGIGLANESSGVIQYQWERDKYATSYGQATSVTALQLVQAMTAITNDGKMKKPFVIEKVVDQNGNVLEGTGEEEVGQPISADTAKKVRDILETVVTEEGATGTRYQIEGYQVAGKTGTAQIYEPGKGYLTGWDNYIFSFIGFAPKEDPKLIMYVMVQQPDLNEDEYESGSVPVSKIFNPVMKSSLQYLNIEPTEAAEMAERSKLPDLVGHSVQEAESILEERKLTPVILGEGEKVIAMSPGPGGTMLENEKVILKTEGKNVIPDLTGWSLRDVMKVAEVTGMNVQFEGSGYVEEQNLQPGSVISHESRLEIKLKPPEGEGE